MIKIGLTGSIAMGKSEVARIWVAQGLPLFDSDKEVHLLYDSNDGGRLLEGVVPEAISDGKIDRAILTRIVLADPDKLNDLEKIIHAEINQRRKIFVETTAKQGHALVVFDIPLLFEKQLENTVDVTVVVSAPLALQQQRALARPGMTPEKLLMILKRQMPDAEKRKRADYIIENDSDLTELHNRSMSILNAIKKAHNL
jgi:dephospho-CoA kinase